PALWQALRVLRPRARAVVVGQAPPSVDGLPLAHLQRWEIDLVTSFRYAHAFPTAISLVDSGRVDVAALVTGRFPVDRTAEALRAAAGDPAHLKVLVRPRDAL
ncbi:NAD(P)-dependent alcohol dehydrogenase, partial [Marinitenerispora sediminis]